MFCQISNNVKCKDGPTNPHPKSTDLYNKQYKSELCNTDMDPLGQKEETGFATKIMINELTLCE